MRRLVLVHLDDVATYGPVYRVCGWCVFHAPAGSLTCRGEEHVGTVPCAATPLWTGEEQ